LVFVKAIRPTLGGAEDPGGLPVEEAPFDEFIYGRILRIGGGKLYEGFRPEVFILAELFFHELPEAVIDHVDEGADEVLVII